MTAPMGPPPVAPIWPSLKVLLALRLIRYSRGRARRLADVLLWGTRRHRAEVLGVAAVRLANAVADLEMDDVDAATVAPRMREVYEAARWFTP